jgi:hypothetical protein
MTARPPARRRPVAHFSDNRLLGFFYGDVLPRLDLRRVWPDLVERGSRLENAVCSGCGKKDTYIYPGGDRLRCSHLNSCDRQETILEKLSGDSWPTGDRLMAAIEAAAALAGVPLPEREVTAEERKEAGLWHRRQQILGFVYQWTQDELWGGAAGTPEALEYLHGRGFDDEGIRTFEVGLYTVAARLETALLEAKLSRKVAADAGLLLREWEGFTTWPWRDVHGNPLTLYGKWPGKPLPLVKEHPGRWSAKDPDKPIPKTYAAPGANTKADLLYLDRVARARQREVVLVEGPTDAAIAHLKGDPRVVAYGGGTLAEKQLQGLVAFRPASVTICPDPDSAGIDGVLSAVRRLGEAGVRAFVAANLPKGTDPDEYILNHGLGAWQTLLDGATPAPMFTAERAIDGISATDPPKRREAGLNQLMALAAELDGDGADIDRQALVELAVKRLGFEERAVRAELKKRRKAVDLARKHASMSAGAQAQEPWEERLIKTYGRGGERIAPNLANVSSILAHHSDWKGVLAYDDLRYRITMLRRPPSHGAAHAPKLYPAPWGDNDDSLVAVWLQRSRFRLDVGVETVARAIPLVGGAQPYHPVRQYLASLEWDRRPRIDGWLIRYLGAVVPEGGWAYVQAVGAKWLISAVARVQEPGCKADAVLILEGAQGLGKSRALSVMAGGWFTDRLSDLGSKDSLQELEGHWIVELAELDVMSKSEVTRAKAFFSALSDKFRPAYGHHTVERPRQCVFVGTVNHAAYLRDETGNRRFWPVRCTCADVDGLQRDRDQLWAEAVVRYQAGERWWLDQATEQLAAEQQSERYQSDEWQSLIGAYIADRGRVAVSQILRDVLKLDPKDWKQAEQTRVAKCLAALKWARKSYRVKPEDLDLAGLSLDKHGRTHIYVPSNDVASSEATGDSTRDTKKPEESTLSPLSPLSPVQSKKVEREVQGNNGERAIGAGTDSSPMTLCDPTGDSGDTGDSPMDTGLEAVASLPSGTPGRGAPPRNGRHPVAVSPGLEGGEL